MSPEQGLMVWAFLEPSLIPQQCFLAPILLMGELRLREGKGLPSVTQPVRDKDVSST